jgi:hypothetical protein
VHIFKTHFHSRKFSTDRKFSENIIVKSWKIYKYQNFFLQNFFPTENLCRPITFYKFFFPRKIFLSGNNWPLVLTRSGCEKCNYRFSGRNRTCGPAIPVQRSKCEAVSTKNRKPTGKKRKNRVNRVFLKIRSKIETTVKKDTTRYSVLTQDIKRKVF